MSRHLHLYTFECQPHGSGICDGFDGICDCPCHTADDLPQTIAEVKVWHDVHWGIAPEPGSITALVREGLRASLAPLGLASAVEPTADKHGNVVAIEGCTRCACGAKYWERDLCASCKAPVDKFAL